jgi:hypothetical protein
VRRASRDLVPGRASRPGAPIAPPTPRRSRIDWRFIEVPALDPKLRAARLAALGLALASLGPAIAAPDPARADDGPAAIFEDAEPPRLTPRQIYDRVLQNRVRSFIQRIRLVSGDAAGRTQTMLLDVYWQDFRDALEQPVDGIISKAFVEYMAPFDLRHYAYLLIRKDQEVDDQFAYFPSQRRARRVNLRKQNIFGTDFSVDDVIPPELQDAEFTRLPNEQVMGVNAYVIEGIPRGGSTSAYTRFVFYVDSQRFVPLKTRYWNNIGIETKELSVDVDSIRKIGDVYLPMKLTMHDNRLDTYTSLEILEFQANPVFPPSTFEAGRLNFSN